MTYRADLSPPNPSIFEQLSSLQVTSRRMRQFNEGEHAREERRKYKKTAQTLTLFIISYIGQWWSWIGIYIWNFFGDASPVLVRNLSLHCEFLFHFS